MSRDTPTPVLVCRDTELADLQQKLLQVGQLGCPDQVLVTGPHGIGTTTLVRRLVADHSARGGRCLMATAVPWEHDVSWGVLSQLVGRRVIPDGPLAAADLLVEAAAQQGDLSDAAAVLVVVDDVAWSDPDSLAALSTAVRHRPDGRFLVVLAGHVATAPEATAEVLDRVPDRLPLGPLDAAGVRALAAAHGTTLHPALAEKVGDFAEGRPGTVVALLTELPTSFWDDYDPTLLATERVQQRVTAGLAELEPPVRALVEAVAVLTEAPVSVAAELADVTEPLVVLDEAVASGLVVALERRGATYVRVVDPMTTAAVRHRVGPRRLADLHGGAAELVDDAAARLTHLVAATAQPDPSLADELEALALERSSTGAWAAAADLLARAARLTADQRQREDRLARSFDALVGAGEIQAAAAGLAEIESLRETPLRNAVLGYLAVVRGRPGEAEKSLGRAWDLVNVDRDPDTAATICQRWVLHSLGTCDGHQLVGWADRALGLAPAGSPAAIEAAAIRGIGLAVTGHGSDALAGYDALASDVGHGAQAQRVALARGWIQVMLDQPDQARASLASALPTDYLGGSARISLWAHGWLARAQFVTGEWDDALTTAEAGLRLVERTGMRLVGPLLWWTVAQVHALRGDWERAHAAVRAGDAGPRDYEIMRVPACLGRAAVAEAAGDYAGVVRALEPLRDRWAGGSIDEPGAWPWVDVCANALVVQGRHDEADALLQPHERRAGERGHRSARARLSYARGRLLGATGDLPDSRRHFETAVDLLADLPLLHDRARVQFAFGQTLRRAGKRREADVAMQTARDAFDGLGASTYVERCDRELRAGGVRAARGTEREAHALTPQEELVADLVAQGMTNREVATDLFISTKTVQYHLTRTYTKLGIRSRGELAAMWRPDPEGRNP